MRIREDLPSDFFSKGFTQETDPFKKSDLANRLTKLYGKLEHGTVSILDGRWGTGKTTFARLWKHDLESNGIPCIYFDAFAADYVDSPFRAVASAFVRDAKAAQVHGKETYDRFLSNASKVVKIIAAPVAKMAVKAGTLGIIGTSEIDDFKSAAEEAASGLGDITEASVKAMLEEQAGDEASFEALRTSLAALPALLAKKLAAAQLDGEESDAEQSPSLVVVIDELDRCRPDFALGILEVLKHFFRAERVHFVLVTNLDHLLLSVQKRYGVGEAAGDYVQKFYDFLIPFEEQQEHTRATSSSIHASRLLRTMLDGADTSHGSDLVSSVGEIVTAYDLTLRQAERVVTNVVLACIDFGQDRYRPGTLVALLATIKAQKPAIFSDIKRRNLKCDQLAQFIESGHWSGERLSSRMIDLVRYYSDPSIDINDPTYKGYDQSVWRYNFDNRLDILPFLAISVIDRFS